MIFTKRKRLGREWPCLSGCCCYYCNHWYTWKSNTARKIRLKILYRKRQYWRGNHSQENRSLFRWKRTTKREKRTLQNTLLTENINKVENGESQLKRVFTKIVDDLGIYYKIGLTTDFTGKLFNEMYGWLGFSQDKLNDVVLTPSYIASLLLPSYSKTA